MQYGRFNLTLNHDMPKFEGATWRPRCEAAHDDYTGIVTKRQQHHRLRFLVGQTRKCH